MKEIRKAPGSVGALSGAETEKAAFGGAAIPCLNNSTRGISSQAEKIWNLLPEGEASAVPADALATLAGYGNTRALRFAVDRLRSKGVPVLASESGYFKPANGPAGIVEIKRFLRRQDARMASNRRATRLIRARLRGLETAPLDGQETIWGGGTDG